MIVSAFERAADMGARLLGSYLMSLKTYQSLLPVRKTLEPHLKVAARKMFLFRKGLSATIKNSILNDNCWENTAVLLLFRTFICVNIPNVGVENCGA